MKALVLYHSEGGNTGLMAEAVAEGLRERGAEVTLWNTKQGPFDIVRYPEYGCLAVGSPDYFSYVAGALKTFMDDWYIHRTVPGMKDKPIVLFYSHGGGGAVKEPMEELFRHLGTQVGATVGVYGRPDAKTINACRDLGRRLADAVK